MKEPMPTESVPSSTSTEKPAEGAASPAKPDTPHPSNKPPVVALIVIFGSVILLSIGIFGGIFASQYFKGNDSPSLTATNDGNTTITQEESSIASVAEKVSPSVVSIVTQTQTRSYYGIASGEAAGTGVIVSKDGYVMTNNHVIQNARSVSIVDNDGNVYDDVDVIGRDPLNDVAFLKINASDKTFTPATLGNSSTIRTGQQVVAIGNALGQYSNTVTSGIISGTGRPITADSGNGETESLTDLIQTDASINPGNSGGPLVNMAGQVIGINTAIVEDANGIGFAIPINATKGILAGVLENGKVARAFIGVGYLSITGEIAREYNLPVKLGAYIYTTDGSTAIARGGPADKAGLKRGDIITKINDEVVGKNGGLSSIIGEYRPGDKVTITYLRDGKEATTTLSFGSYTG